MQLKCAQAGVGVEEGIGGICMAALIAAPIAAGVAPETAVAAAIGALTAAATPASTLAALLSVGSSVPTATMPAACSVCLPQSVEAAAVRSRWISYISRYK